MNVMGVIALFLYLGFGAITNENGIAPMVEQYISEEHSNDSERLKNYFRWMCSILWIVFWPIFLIWGLINELLDLDE